MQPMTRCENGHYYDAKKHQSCPFCGVQKLDIDIQKTMAKKSGPPPVKSGSEQPAPPVGGPPEPPINAPADSGKTVGVYRRKMGIDPVVGWLVAVKGPDKGRDFRITAEKNFIGRSEAMDISISGDDSISRESHAIISYNPKNNSFRVYPGESKRLVYLNEEEVIMPEQLKAYDVIELGETTLRFIPLCGEQFEWD